MIPIDLSGKVALITGASRGIGHQTMMTLQEAGAHCIGVSRSMVTETAGSSESIAADVSREDDIDRVVDRVKTSHGALDILVNCAGFNIRESVDEVQSQHFDDIIATNVRAPFLLMKKFFPLLKLRQGSIVNITSLASHVGNPYQGAYAVSKGGLAMLTKVAATEFGAYNVRVNAISPGYIRTPLTEPLWKDPAFFSRVVEHTALKRLGSPEEIAGVVAFLASPFARYITGEVIVVDGGYLAGDQGLVPTSTSYRVD